MNYPRKYEANKADQLFQKAYLAHQGGRLEEAERYYRQALRITPSDFETLYLLGTACSQQRKFEEAAGYLQKALKIDADHPEALNNMGLTLRGQLKSEEALSYYRRALALRPDYVDAHCNLADALENLRRLDEAEEHARLALRLNPNLANGYYVLGLVLTGKDRFEEAAQCFLKGLELKPEFSAAYNDLGGIYRTWGRLDDALACFDRAIALNPQAYNSHNNRGAVYEELGRLDEALVEYETATRLQPADPVSKWNTAYLYLRQGILDRGWEAHEMRLNQVHVHDRFPYPTWDGSSLEGKTILVFAEQGLGDEIFFASCIPDVIARAAHCVVECDERLAPLFARSFPEATVQGAKRLDIGWILGMPRIDTQIAAGSLPRFLRPTLGSFPKTRAYLAADPLRVEHWRSRLAALGPELKVGICWRSGLTKGERHKQYSQLMQWGNIFGVAGVRFINLQYDECSEELRQAEQEFGVTITNFAGLDMKNELDETCALISSLDLVISAGTAVSEMAGALGVDVFRLDVFGKPMDALGTGRSPWHPSMKLFGQISLGDWDTPLAQVAEALKERALGVSHEDEYVALACGAEVAVSGVLEDLSTYVLREKRGWFDAEYEFVLGMVRPGMRIVDVGAGIGAYSIPLARKSQGGRLWSITRTPAETDMLLRSRRQNALEKSMVVTIADRNGSLDSEMDRHGLGDIAFVRVASDFCSTGMFAGAARFFAMNSPLLMFGITPGDSGTAAVIQWLVTQGYGIYRLVPGLNLLIPLASLEDLDAFGSNLFACKPDRAEALESEGILIRQHHTLNELPGIDHAHWQEYLKPLPYAASRVDGWAGSPQKPADWEVYWMALNLYAMAKSDRPAAERFASLHAAGGVLGTLVQQQATLPRLLSLGRCLCDLGKREAAVSLLNQICAILNSGVSATLDEPCLALSEAFERHDPGSRVAEWIVAMLLAQRESLRAFSDYFTGQEALPVLNEVKALGFGSEEIDRRIALIDARFAEKGWLASESGSPQKI